MPLFNSKKPAPDTKPLLDKEDKIFIGMFSTIAACSTALMALTPLGWGSVTLGFCIGFSIQTIAAIIMIARWRHRADAWKDHANYATRLLEELLSTIAKGGKIQVSEINLDKPEAPPKVH